MSRTLLASLVLLVALLPATYEAAYEMREVDGVWRINGVHLRAVPGAGV